jgi:DNA-binding transcriptional regulator YbjK
MARERGAQRRQAIVEAAAALIEREGFDAVTHRAVAAAASVPLGSTTYYFASLADLRRDAVGLLVAREAAAAEARAPIRRQARRPETVARIVLEVLYGVAALTDRDALLMIIDRLVQSARYPEVRTLVHAGRERIEDAIAEVLERSGVAVDAVDDRALLTVLIAASDGAMLTALAEGDPDPAASAEVLLTRILSDLR